MGVQQSSLATHRIVSSKRMKMLCFVVKRSSLSKLHFVYEKNIFRYKTYVVIFRFSIKKKLLFRVWKIMLPKASSHQVSMIGSLVVVNRMLLLSVGRITNDPDTSKLNSVMPRVWNKNSKSTRESLGWVKLFQKNSSERKETSWKIQVQDSTFDSHLVQGWIDVTSKLSGLKHLIR